MLLRDRPEWVLMCKACKDDDTTAMDTVVDEAISKSNKEDLKYLYKIARHTATQDSAITVLNNLIGWGVDVLPMWPSAPKGASKETLELLLQQGWDINEGID